MVCMIKRCIFANKYAAILRKNSQKRWYKTVQHVLSFALVLISFHAQSQQIQGDKMKEIAGIEEVDILMKETKAWGLNLHSSGYGIDFRRGKQKTAFKNVFWHFNVNTLKHAKETQTLNRFYERSSSFIYGKINNVWQLKINRGFTKNINPKGDNSSVAISYGVMVGASINIIKPIYLDIIQDESTYENPIIASERYKPEIHPIEDVLGRSFFLKGIEESKIWPSIQLQSFMSAEWNKKPKQVNLLEAGFGFDYFFRPLPILAYEQNKSLIVNLFIRVLIGNKWNPLQTM